jgi:hypothetical protein
VGCRPEAPFSSAFMSPAPLQKGRGLLQMSNRQLIEELRKQLKGQGREKTGRGLSFAVLPPSWPRTAASGHKGDLTQSALPPQRREDVMCTSSSYDGILSVYHSRAYCERECVSVTLVGLWWCRGRWERGRGGPAAEAREAKPVSLPSPHPLLSTPLCAGYFIFLIQRVKYGIMGDNKGKPLVSIALCVGPSDRLPEALTRPWILAGRPPYLSLVVSSR